VLHVAVTVVLVAVLVWLLWPSGPLRAEAVTVRPTSPALACNGAEDLVATVRTNGRSGRLHYQWIRSDGTSSAPLTARLKRHQGTVDLPLHWSFRGAGSYAAEVTIMVQRRQSDGGVLSASTRFTYRCSGS
jgi:hypothetical protein